MRQNWFAAAVIYKEAENGCVTFLLQKSEAIHPRYPAKIKFPGGMRGRNDKTSQRTVAREVREETGLKLKKGGYPQVVFSVVDHDRTKKFFLFNALAFDGELRKEELLDGDSRLFPPYWADLNEAQISLCSSHQPGLIEALKYLGLMR